MGDEQNFKKGGGTDVKKGRSNSSAHYALPNGSSFNKSFSKIAPYFLAIAIP